MFSIREKQMLKHIGVGFALALGVVVSAPEAYAQAGAATSSNLDGRCTVAQLEQMVNQPYSTIACPGSFSKFPGKVFEGVGPIAIKRRQKEEELPIQAQPYASCAYTQRVDNPHISANGTDASVHG